MGLLPIAATSGTGLDEDVLDHLLTEAQTGHWRSLTQVSGPTRVE